MLLSFLMMITRAKAVPQVIGFLAMENGLFFAATAATYGMPMVVALGIALDVLIGVLILGCCLLYTSVNITYAYPGPWSKRPRA